MNKEDIQEASKILFEHRLNKTGLSSLKNLEPKTIDEAYAIQDNLKLRYLEPVSYTHLTLPTTPYV